MGRWGDWEIGKEFCFHMDFDKLSLTVVSFGFWVFYKDFDSAQSDSCEFWVLGFGRWEMGRWGDWEIGKEFCFHMDFDRLSLTVVSFGFWVVGFL
jgi:hypothetical protein